MFEQELYRFDTPAPEQKPGDLFYEFEIKSWKPGPRLYKIVGVSALINLLILTVFTQGNLLTRRGCDSPFVGRVCEVLDTVYVATMIFGTEREYVDKAYEKTELEDADITYIDVSNAEPQFQYPEGYFQIANPEMAYNQTDPYANYGGTIPGISSDPMTSNPLVNTPPITPKYNPRSVQGTVPDSPFSVSNDSSDANTSAVSTRKGRRGGKPTADNSNTVASNPTNTNTNPTLDPNATANPDEAKEDQYGVFINKRPMKDKAKETLEQFDSKTVTLDGTFKVAIGATLGTGKDGKTVVLKNPKPLPTQSGVPNDPKLVKLAQDWILAVGDAGWFGYMARIDPKPKNVVVTIELNNDNLIASVSGDQPNDAQAKKQASSLNLLLGAAVLALKDGDEKTFLQKASVTSDGKNFILNFSIPRPEAIGLIQRKLAESKDPNKQPNGTAIVGPQNNAAAK